MPPKRAPKPTPKRNNQKRNNRRKHRNAVHVARVIQAQRRAGNAPGAVRNTMAVKSLEMSIAFPFDHPQRFPMLVPQPTNFLANRESKVINTHSADWPSVVSSGPGNDVLLALFGFPGLTYGMKVAPSNAISATDILFYNSSKISVVGAPSPGTMVYAYWDLVGPLSTEVPNAGQAGVSRNIMPLYAGPSDWPVAGETDTPVPSVYTADKEVHGKYGIVGTTSNSGYIFMDDYDVLIGKFVGTVRLQNTTNSANEAVVLRIDISVRLVRHADGTDIPEEPVVATIFNSSIPAGDTVVNQQVSGGFAVSTARFGGTLANPSGNSGVPGWYKLQVVEIVATIRGSTTPGIGLGSAPVLTLGRIELRRLNGLPILDPLPGDTGTVTTSANVLDMFDWKAPYDSPSTWAPFTQRNYWRLFDSTMLHSTQGGDDTITDKVRTTAASLLITNTTPHYHRGGLMTCTRRVGFDHAMSWSDLTTSRYESFDAIEGAFTFLMPEASRMELRSVGGRTAAGRVPLEDLNNSMVHYIHISPPLVGGASTSSLARPNTFRLTYDELLEFQADSKRYTPRPCPLGTVALTDAIRKLEQHPEYFYRNADHASKIYDWIATTGRRIAGFGKRMLPAAAAYASVTAPQYLPLIAALQGLAVHQ